MRAARLVSNWNLCALARLSAPRRPPTGLRSWRQVIDGRLTEFAHEERGLVARATW